MSTRKATNPLLPRDLRDLTPVLDDAGGSLLKLELENGGRSRPGLALVLGGVAGNPRKLASEGRSLPELVLKNEGRSLPELALELDDAEGSLRKLVSGGRSRPGLALVLENAGNRLLGPVPGKGGSRRLRSPKLESVVGSHLMLENGGRSLLGLEQENGVRRHLEPELAQGNGARQLPELVQVLGLGDELLPDLGHVQDSAAPVGGDDLRNLELVQVRVVVALPKLSRMEWLLLVVVAPS